MKKIDRERQESIEYLRGIIVPGAEVCTVLRHVSRSGMYRRIDCVIDVHGDIRNISYHVAKACGDKIAKDGGIGVSGCGQDMGYAIVHNLGYVLFPDGFTCTGYDPDNRSARCPSNDHSNGDRDYTPHHHSSGGYALRHRWL